ncbi:hypothetical protein N7G274_000556 [Stereocaulon virgatum]|uniref:Cytochrome b561 domain-containing protein n=1 Tax=Stereocaulon virgatum TaxID=373712 RepID=A0ABR4ASG8_9LECA
MKSTALFMVLWLATLASAQEKHPVRHKALIAHSALMGFTFAFLLPMGAIVLRISTVRGLVWIHAGIQAFAWILALAGLGLGVYLAIYPDYLVTASNGHSIIGIIVVTGLAFQPIAGYVHHLIYKKDKRRSFWAPLHVWWGRIFITAGIINGGLGTQLSDNTVKGKIAYGVIAGVIWLTWVGVVAWASIKDGKDKGEAGAKAYGHRMNSNNLDSSPESKEVATHV